MKKIAVFVLLTVVWAAAFAQVQGELTSVGDKRVLKVWGTHYERGYAVGYLQAAEIMDGFTSYFLGSVFMNNANTYNYYLNIFLGSVIIDAVYQQEVGGIIDGMTAAGQALHCTTLGRDITTDDLMMLNSIVDLSGAFDLGDFGCSSFSAWGAATAADPQLAGEMVITRLMDWSMHPYLFANSLLVVHFPAEADEQPWMSFTYPGFIGTLSGINAQQVSAFMNMGNHHEHPTVQACHPILFTIRNGLEQVDYNNDGICSNDDITQAISDKVQLSGHIIHATDADGALIIECNNENGVATRSYLDNTVIPEFELVATNHFRTLYAPTGCYRYTSFSDSLMANAQITVQRSWDVTAGAGGITTNIHAIQYVPSLDLVLWSTATTGHAAYTLAPTPFTISTLFDQPSAAPGHVAAPTAWMQVYPNPVQLSAARRGAVTTIAFELSNPCSTAQIEIFNLRGQTVRELEMGISGSGSGLSSRPQRRDLSFSTTWDGLNHAHQPVSSGLYLCRLVADGTTVAQQKIMVIK
jgi:hypothetical protein